jgi:hypothetical protein
VVAYLSLAHGENLADRFRVDGRVLASDKIMVQAIMDARTKLIAAGLTAPGWRKFRAGDYQGAVVGL